jgi:predicted phosphodiesterase
LRFIVFGDSKGKKNGINEKVLNEILKQIKKLNPFPDYIIHLGDMTAGSDNMNKLKDMLDGFINSFTNMNIKNTIMPVFGNHEEGENPKNNSGEIVFGETFKEYLPDGEVEGYNRTVYFKDVDNIRIIVLNSCHFCEENRISGKQLKWFNNALEAMKDFKIVFVHIPPYPTGAHLGTSMDLYTEKRDEFWSIIDQKNVDIVFSGHEHNYSRRIINESLSTEKYKFSNNIYQIISGGGGEKLRDKYKSKIGVVVAPIPKNHYIVIDILNKRLVLKAYDIKGNIIDEFEINK